MIIITLIVGIITAFAVLFLWLMYVLTLEKIERDHEDNPAIPPKVELIEWVEIELNEDTLPFDMQKVRWRSRGLNEFSGTYYEDEKLFLTKEGQPHFADEVSEWSLIALTKINI